jgi:hypothetical protein
MPESPVFNLEQFPLHLGPGASALRQPQFSGNDWYQGYGERHGGVRTIVLGLSEAVINPPGVWHTADVSGPCTALFITPGLRTETRPRT